MDFLAALDFTKIETYFARLGLGKPPAKE